MTQTTIPSGDNSLLPSIQMRQVGRLERIIGPDNYRILTGLFKTLASIIGFSLLVMFILVAIFAPVLAPPKATGDPFQIPRDGFSADSPPAAAPRCRESSETTSGRLVSMCGQIGGITIAGSVGLRIGPPAARLYAVEPVGEETMMPSARNDETKTPPTETSSSMMREGPAFVITTSFSTSAVMSGRPRRCTSARKSRRSSCW